jgi:hypothetical protein
MDENKNKKGTPSGAPETPQAGKSEARPSTTELRADGGLEQIREILFGAGSRELERRVVRVDSQFGARISELEQETRRRIELLESHISRETESVMGRFKAELSTHAEALRKLASEHHTAVGDLEQKLARAEEASARAHRELRQQLLEQAKSFLDELQQLRKDLLATLQEELALGEGEPIEAPREPQELTRH